jgi:hypothetical protein
MFVCGDARKLPLPDETIQCAFTSPPYFQLRNYQCGGRQIGLEAAPEAYLAALIEVFRVVRRVLRPPMAFSGWSLGAATGVLFRPAQRVPPNAQVNGFDRHSLAHLHATVPLQLFPGRNP